MDIIAKNAGGRLLDFGKSIFGEKHGWKAKFARSLDMSQSALQRYTDGHISIGPVVQDRLRALGADVEYIMTGKRNETEDRVKNLEAEFEALKNEIRGTTTTGTIQDTAGRSNEAGNKVLVGMLNEYGIFTPQQLGRLLRRLQKVETGLPDAIDSEPLEHFTASKKLNMHKTKSK